VTGGTLYIVATPIGNLGDVTIRALEVLGSVPIVAAEDTRLTRRLFARHHIGTALTSFHARNARSRLPDLLARLRSGEDVALVTDAGTPSVSDPGEELVAAWAAEGGRVVPIPGASAALAAVSATGIAGPRWSFEGFLPRSGRERRERLERLAADPRGAVLFEAPGRLAATLADLVRICGADRPGAVCRELTKLHESIVRGTLGTLAADAAEGTIPPRGEMTVVVGALTPAAAAAHEQAAGRERATRDVTEAEARERVAVLVSSGMASGDAARRVAGETGIPRRRLYIGADRHR
jgi:16S rRNA (cytidine1402-2'-O)-methyltransferase